MAHYRFYGMVGTMIISAENAQCADDAEASGRALSLLDDADATYDAIEAWQGARLVCRHERAQATNAGCRSREPD